MKNTKLDEADITIEECGIFFSRTLSTYPGFWVVVYTHLPLNDQSSLMRLFIFVYNRFYRFNAWRLWFWNKHKSGFAIHLPDIYRISLVDSLNSVIPAQSVLYGPPIGLVFPVTMPSCWFLSTGVTWNSYQELSDKFVMAKNWYRPPVECGTSGHSFHNTVWKEDNFIYFSH